MLNPRAIIGKTNTVGFAKSDKGGEQGDPLMPLLFCSSVHNALMAVQEQLLPGEHVFAFLDDVYAL